MANPSKRDQLRGKIGAKLIRLFGVLPLGINRHIGTLVGLCTWWSKGRTLRITLENIEKCLPELDHTARQRLAKQSLIETGRTAMEAASIWVQPYRRLEKYIKNVENQSLIDQAFAQGKGLTLLIPHLGNWEIIGPYLAEQYPVTYMFSPTSLKAIDELMITGRTRNGGTLAPANLRGVSSVLKKLKANELIGILPDQVPETNGGEIAPLFGQPALTMTLVHKLTQRTGCAVVFGFAERVPGGFTLKLYAPPADLYSDNIEKSLTAMNEQVEALVRKAPAQYQWEYKRFKRV
ncbi:lysophospholipid acyltransferase [Aurantivibrio plasticivorans]